MTHQQLKEQPSIGRPDPLRAFLDIIGSLWFAAVLMLLLIVSMGSATVYESMYGTEMALGMFYQSWWFIGLLWLLVVNVIVSIIVRYPFTRRNIGFLLTHLGIVLTLAGAEVTYLWGIDGRMGFAEGETVDRFRVPVETLTLVDTRNKAWAREDLNQYGLRGVQPVNNPAVSLQVDSFRVNIERYLPDARWVQETNAEGQTQWTVEEVSPPRETRTPMLLVHWSGGADSGELWVQKFRRVMVPEASGPYMLTYSDKELSLGFRMKLDQFHVGTYPGTGRPRSFESRVTIIDPQSGGTEQRLISMNNPTTYGGYTFYQASYQMGGGQRVSYLSVSRDPGQAPVYAGYFVTLAGMIIVLLTRISDHRRAVRVVAPAIDVRKTVTRTLPLVLVGLLAKSASAQATLPVNLNMNDIRGLVVQYDGRWAPLDTVARETVRKVTGEEFFEDHDPVELLLAWTFNPNQWMHEPLIDIGNAELRHELDLPAEKEQFSYDELARDPRLREIHRQALNLPPGQKPDPLQSKAGDIFEQLITLDSAFTNDLIRPIPNPTDANGAWSTIDMTAKPAADDLAAVQEAWRALGKAFLTDDEPAFAKASAQLEQALAALPAAYRPPTKLIKTELRYNALRPFHRAWMVMIAGAVLAALALIARRNWIEWLAIIVMIAGFAILTYGLYLRWQIAGRIPASNMFESLLFLSWGMGAFAILSMLVLSDRVVPLTASAMGALALVLAAELLDPFIHPVVPVLRDTIWMSIHVPIIMVSYSVLALAVLIAHVQLVAMAAAPGRRTIAEAIDRLHYWYVHVGAIMLLLGIITGSMWAASSWGRYWGWDPKEVWSLVAFLGYLTILHVRIDRQQVPLWAYVVAALLGGGVFVIVAPMLGQMTPNRMVAFGAIGVAMIVFVLGRGRFATAVKSIVAFWLIVMTYLGVNYVLGIGLHSYGFGTGAVAWKMMEVGGIDLAFVAACAAIYYLRRYAVARASCP